MDITLDGSFPKSSDEDVHNLAIIGNGFDYYYGLPADRVKNIGVSPGLASVRQETIPVQESIIAPK